MPLAALILAHIDEESGAATQPLLLTLGGQSLLERLVYQAGRIGCRHVVVCAGPLPAAMLTALDRLKSRGVDIALARSPREAADFLHPDEDVLVLANAVVLADDTLNTIAEAGVGCVLTVPEAWGRDRFERIDATDNWTGVGLLPARMIRDTVAMLGEWAFAPTLLRRAIQQGVARSPLALRSEGETDEIAPIIRDDLVGTARAISRSAKVRLDGVVEQFGLAPVIRPLASWIALKPVSASLIAGLAILSGAGCIIASGFGLAVASFLLLILAAAFGLLARLVGQTGIPEPRPLATLLNGRPLWLPMALLVTGAQILATRPSAMAVAILSVWLAIQMLLTIQVAAKGVDLPAWRPGNAGIALGLAFAFGLGWPVIGLTAALVVTLAVQIWAQRRIARN